MNKELSELIYTNINEWIIAYYRVWTCRIIVECNIEFKDEKAIRKMLESETNTMLRKISKFKNILTSDDYTRAKSLVKSLHDDTYRVIIKSLYKEGVM